MIALAGVISTAVSPLTASAQAMDDIATPEPGHQEPAPLSEPAEEEPVLRLEADATGVNAAKSNPSTAHLEPSARRARAWLGVSVVSFAGGVTMVGVGFANAQLGASVCLSEPCPQTPAWAIVVGAVGLALAAGRLAGIIVGGRRLANAKRQLRWYASTQESRHGKPRRARWDLAQSRLVF